MMKKSFFFIFVLLLLSLTGCTGEVISPAKTDLASNAPTTCESGSCPCESPIGLVPHNQTFKMYTATSVACGASCDTVARTISCNNGQLSENVTALSVRCELVGCKGCLVEGNLIKHGEAAPFYSAAEATCSQTCEGLKSMRTCMDGELRGSTQHPFLNCQQRSCKCELPLNQGAIYVGQNVQLHTKPAAACGETCAEIRLERTCEEVSNASGTIYRLSGADTYQNVLCNEAINCECALPTGLGKLAHGGVKRLFMASEAPCGESCESKGYMDVQCMNGKLFRSGTTTPEINVETTPYKFNCTPTACVGCTVSGRTFTAKTSFYKQNTVSCFQQCTDVKVDLECNDGKVYIDNVLALEGQTAGLQTYCNENCKYCDRGNGQQVPTGSISTFYKMIPITESAACGKTCPSIAKKCVDGNWVGDAGYTLPTCNLDSICNTEGGGAPPWACLMPWADKQATFITPGAKITVYKRNKVACSDSCANYAKVAECDRKSGLLKNGGSEYIYSACREDCP